jgi:hypothetical protein
MTGPEAADALDMTPELFRKRLQHARAGIMAFTRTYCGLVSDQAACACHRRVPAAVTMGRVRTDRFDFAVSESSFHEARALIQRVENGRRALALFRANHPRASSVDFAQRLARALDARRD